MENSAITRNLNKPYLNPVEIETLFLNRLASTGQKSLADHLVVNESTVSRWKSEGYFKQIAEIMSFFGIQAAPEDAVLVSRRYLAALETLADIGLQSERNKQG